MKPHYRMAKNGLFEVKLSDHLMVVVTPSDSQSPSWIRLVFDLRELFADEDTGYQFDLGSHVDGLLERYGGTNALHAWHTILSADLPLKARKRYSYIPLDLDVGSPAVGSDQVKINWLEFLTSIWHRPGREFLLTLPEAVVVPLFGDRQPKAEDSAAS